MASWTTLTLVIYKHICCGTEVVTLAQMFRCPLFELCSGLTWTKRAMSTTACQKTCIPEEEFPVGGSLGYPAVNHHRSSTTRGRGKARASSKRARIRPNRNESVRGHRYRGGDSQTLSSRIQSSQRCDRSWNSDWRTVFRAGVSALGVLVAP